MFKHLFILFAPMLCAVTSAAYAGGRPVYELPEVIEWCQVEVALRVFESKSFEDLHPVCKIILYEDHRLHLLEWKRIVCFGAEELGKLDTQDYRFCKIFNTER